MIYRHKGFPLLVCELAVFLDWDWEGLGVAEFYKNKNIHTLLRESSEKHKIICLFSSNLQLNKANNHVSISLLFQILNEQKVKVLIFILVLFGIWAGLSLSGRDTCNFFPLTNDCSTYFTISLFHEFNFLSNAS
jgi:hypothetical protein